MIPLRVCLQNFMSYGAEQTFSFEGATLWMLSGDNGAGKSTVFDAMTYALYGSVRSRSTDAVELIHHGENGLRVEFDFASGDRKYRVRRTLTRKKNSASASLQAFQIGDDDSLSAIAETDKNVGFKRWLDQTLGLDETTFTSSVLLQQGRSDALLNCDPAKRHEILGQIVDLSAYAQLHETTSERRKAREAELRVLDTQLTNVRVVSDQEIADAEQQVADAQIAIEAAQTAHEELTNARADAVRWRDWLEQHAEISRLLREDEQLQNQSENIERDAKRFGEIDVVLPALSRLAEEEKALHLALTAKNACHESAQNSQKKYDEAQVAQDEAQAIFDQHKTNGATLETARADAESALQKLAPHLAQLKKLDEAGAQLQTVDKGLAQFDDDLDSQLYVAQHNSARHTQLTSFQPWLRRFCAARASWRQAHDALQVCENDTLFKQNLEQTSNELEAAQSCCDTSSTRCSHAQTQQAVAKSKYDAAQKRASQFNRIEGKPDCEFCGQELTPEHLEAERARVEKVSQDAKSELQAATTEHDDATQEAAQNRDALKLCQQLYEKAQREHNQNEAEKTRLAREIERERDNAREALAQWPREFLGFLGLETPPSRDAWSDAVLQADYPTENDEKEVANEIAATRSSGENVASLLKSQRERDKLAAQREPIAQEYETLRIEYSMEQEQTLRDDQTHWSQAHERLENECGEAQTLCQNAATSLETAISNCESLRVVRENAKGAHDIAAMRCEEKAAATQKTRDALPHAWRDLAAQWNYEKLQVLQDEHALLHDAPQTWKQLQSAQAEHASRQETQRNLELQMAQIPAASQRSVEEIDGELQSAKTSEQTATQSFHGAQNQCEQLRQAREKRQQLETSRAQTDRSAALHRVLKQLDREHLQRHLLRQAEISIVEHANAVLDRISGGALRLALQSEDARKALDLVAFNDAIGEEPMPVYLLSGSQRFRVAVSLALGIGQFASHNSQRLESVVIDEGFGSLDKNGRREMIDELHNLKGVLSRIILVSHQDEFADAFPNRYCIELRDGQSHATLREV